MRLTQASVKALSLPSGLLDKLFFDDELPGFGFRIRDGGKRTWIAQYRLGKSSGQTRSHVIACFRRRSYRPE